MLILTTRRNQVQLLRFQIPNIMIFIFLANIIKNLPSRKREKTEVNGGLKKNPLAKFRAAVRMALLMSKLVEYYINRKKERKKRRKKGEIIETVCKIS